MTPKCAELLSNLLQFLLLFVPPVSLRCLLFSPGIVNSFISSYLNFSVTLSLLWLHTGHLLDLFSSVIWYAANFKMKVAGYHIVKCGVVLQRASCVSNSDNNLFVISEIKILAKRLLLPLPSLYSFRMFRYAVEEVGSSISSGLCTTISFSCVSGQPQVGFLWHWEAELGERQYRGKPLHDLFSIA